MRNVGRKNGRLRSSTADSQVENKRKDVDFQVRQIERTDGNKVKRSKERKEKSPRRNTRKPWGTTRSRNEILGPLCVYNNTLAQTGSDAQTFPGLIGCHTVPGPKELPDPRASTLAAPLSFKWLWCFQGLALRTVEDF